MPDIHGHVLHLWDIVVIEKPGKGHECYRQAKGTIVRLAPSSGGVDAEVVFDDIQLGAHLFEPSEILVLGKLEKA